MKNVLLENKSYQEALKLGDSLQFPSAKKAYRAIIEKAEAPQEVIAQSLTKLGFIHYRYGEIDELKNCIEELETFELNKAQTVYKILLLGDYYRNNSQIESQKYYNLALETSETNLEECRDLLSHCLLMKSTTVGVEEQKELLLKSYESAKTTHSPKDLSTAAIFLGMVYYKDLEIAEDWFLKAEKTIRENIEYPQCDLIKLYTFKAGTYINHCQYEKAIEYCLLTEKIYDEFETPLPLYFYLYVLNYLSYSYNALGDSYEAIYASQKALTLGEKLQNKGRIHSCIYLARDYHSIGKTTLSQKYADKALELFKDLHADWETHTTPYELDHIYFILGIAYDLTHPSKAQDYLERALAYIEKTQKDPKENVNYAFIYERLVYLNPNPKGLQYGEQSLQAEHPNPYILFQLMGDAHLSMGEENTALEHYFKALNTNLKDSDPFTLQTSGYRFQNLIHAFNILLKIGETHFKIYQQERSSEHLSNTLQHFDYAFALMDLIKKGIDDKSQILVNNQLPDAYSFYIKALLKEPIVNYTKILSIFESCKGNLLQQNLIDKQVKEKLKHLPFSAKERQLKTEIRQLEQAMNQTTKEEEKTKVFEQFFEKRKAYKALVQSLEQAHPKYFNAKFDTQAPSIEAIQQILDKDEKLLHYLISTQEILILYIDKNEVQISILDKPEDLERNIKSFQQAISIYEKQAYQKSAVGLYQALISPIADLLFGLFGNEQISNLTIIPHSQLFKIPFETLFGNIESAQPDYLINHFDICYHYSIKLWYEGRRTGKEMKKGFLGFAPIYTGSVNENGSSLDRAQQENSWMPLPHSKKEVEGIAKLYKKLEEPVRLLLNREASKWNLRDSVGQFGVIHLAAHFHQNLDVPQKSGLVLEDNQYLFVDDVYSWEIEAQLVVLSACQSGTGTLSDSEGFLAITRGLLYAGAQNIVTTLFEVNDKITSQLMIQFYQEIIAGKNIRSAFNSAKRHLIKDTEVFEKEWAAFTLVGN